jgi:hypothetical protein
LFLLGLLRQARYFLQAHGSVVHANVVDQAGEVTSQLHVLAAADVQPVGSLPKLLLNRDCFWTDLASSSDYMSPLITCHQARAKCAPRLWI